MIKNAEKLNISIKDVNIVIISHGHKDHGGGMEAFLKQNNKAKIYISKYAFDNYYVSILKCIKVYVGLNQELKGNERIILTDEIYTIDENLTLLLNIIGNLLIPTGNKNLMVKNNGKFSLDNFKHEQHLILNSNDKKILIAGCSHTGILNILNNIEEKLNLKINLKIGGLHLYNPLNKKTENINFINELGIKLLEKNIKIYTCHCTGEKAFKLLSSTLNNNILTIKTGQVLKL